MKEKRGEENVFIKRRVEKKRWKTEEKRKIWNKTDVNRHAKCPQKGLGKSGGGIQQASLAIDNNLFRTSPKVIVYQRLGEFRQSRDSGTKKLWKGHFQILDGTYEKYFYNRNSLFFQITVYFHNIFG